MFGSQRKPFSKGFALSRAWLGFYVLPFDYHTDPDSKVQIPIDELEFAKALHAQCPKGEITNIGGLCLYVVSPQNDPWVAASLGIDAPTIFHVRAEPRTLAIRLLLWYRRQVSREYRLYAVESITGLHIELTGETRQKELETFFNDRGITLDWECC